jgi:chromosome segregation ATPase
MSEENTADLTLDEKLDLLLAEMRELKAEMREVKETVGGLDTRLTALESKVEDRLHDTRPIWQLVQQQIVDLQTEVVDLKTEVINFKTETNARFESVEKELRIMNRKFEVFSLDIMKMRTDIRDFDVRLAEVERRPM